MMSRLAGFTWLIALFAQPPALADDGLTPKREELNFRVLLDGKPIGFHNFRIEEAGDARYVESDAEFRVRFLFVTAYRYQHSHRERWLGSCLSALESETITNGKQVEVSGERTSTGFVVESSRGVSDLSDCVMSFAYWDRRILEEAALLNVQTGELVDITVQDTGTEDWPVNGRTEQAERHRLTGENLQIDLWYSPEGRWLGLEAPAKGGRTLRYELT